MVQLGDFSIALVKTDAKSMPLSSAAVSRADATATMAMATHAHGLLECIVAKEHNTWQQRQLDQLLFEAAHMLIKHDQKKVSSFQDCDIHTKTATMSALQATVAQCRFTTARLEVANWHDEMTSISGSDDHTATGQPAVVRETLTQWVVALLSDEQTTGKLPPPWQGPYDNARAAQWMADRDREGTVLLAAERDTGDNVGLVILGVDGREVRLGYVLAECKWCVDAGQ